MGHRQDGCGVRGGRVRGLVGGGASFGDALLGGLVSGASAWAFGSLPLPAGGTFWDGAQRAVGYGMLGGVTSVLRGGRFGHGFVSSGLSGAFHGPVGGRVGQAFGSAALGEVAAAAVIGGTATELTGGKFANGAATGAFQAAIQSAGRSTASGGGGIRKEGFVLDTEGNVVYSDEVRGPFVEAEQTTVTDDFMAERGVDGEGRALYHAGKDIVPLNADGSVRTDDTRSGGPRER